MRKARKSKGRDSRAKVFIYEGEKLVDTVSLAEAFDVYKRAWIKGYNSLHLRTTASPRRRQSAGS